MSAHRRIDVVCSGGRAWCGIDEQGVTLVMKDSRDEVVDTVSNAGTSDLPVTVRVHRPDGTVEIERVFPEAPLYNHSATPQ